MTAATYIPIADLAYAGHLGARGHDVFGAGSVVCESPNASVVATEPTKLLVLSHKSFDHFMSVMPEFRLLFSAHTDAFRKLAQLTHAKLELFDAISSLRELLLRLGSAPVAHRGEQP